MLCSSALAPEISIFRPQALLISLNCNYSTGDIMKRLTPLEKTATLAQEWPIFLVQGNQT